MIRNKTLLLLGAVLLLTVTSTAYAASGSGKIPEVIDLVPVRTEDPAPTPDPRPVVVNNYDMEDKDAEKLARLLWSSPLRDEEAKKVLVYVVLNRASYGEIFDNTISGNITTHEFHFFDSKAHISAENVRIVKEAYNEWMSRKAGNNVGKTIPVFAYYIRFSGTDNRQIECIDFNRNVLGVW